MKVRNRTIFIVDGILAKYARVPSMRLRWGITRNRTVLAAIIAEIRRALGLSEQMNAFVQAYNALGQAGRDPSGEQWTDWEQRYGVTHAEYQEFLRQEEELLQQEADVTFFRIPVQHLPGWDDPKTTEKILDVAEMTLLLQLGILYDEDDA